MLHHGIYGNKRTCRTEIIYIDDFQEVRTSGIVYNNKYNDDCFNYIKSFFTTNTTSLDGVADIVRQYAEPTVDDLEKYGSKLHLIPFKRPIKKIITSPFIYDSFYNKYVTYYK